MPDTKEDTALTLKLNQKNLIKLGGLIATLIIGFGGLDTLQSGRTESVVQESSLELRDAIGTMQSDVNRLATSVYTNKIGVESNAMAISEIELQIAKGLGALESQLANFQEAMHISLERLDD